MNSASRPDRSQFFRCIGVVVAAIVLNCLLFGVYRWLFVTKLASSDEVGRILRYGLRLDLALLGFELCGIGLFTVLLRRLSVRRVTRWLWALTALHAFICVSNYFSFAERSQNSGDLLLPYITSPYQVWLAVLPFIQQHWILMLGLGLGGGFYFWIGLHLSRRLEGEIPPVDLWTRRCLLSIVPLLVLSPLMMTWQPLIKRKDLINGKGGLSAVFANSKFYTHFADFRENEAVLNPLFEFVGNQLPNALHQKIRYRMTENEALSEWQKDNGPELDAHYPLLETLQGRNDSKIENVVIIQVEGLSGSVLEQERNGRPVTPFLRKIAHVGLYFPNTFQNANFTSGGIFSTASSVPKATWEEPTHRFASHESHGYYSSLAHVLGNTNYAHYFCQAFRQSGDDFLTFMAYQGCEVFNYQKIRDRLTPTELADSDSILGIHDGYLMQETAEILAKCPTRFTAHLMTCTTHSPWSVPPSFGKHFDEPDLNTFAYLDASIEALVNRIEQNEKLRDTTLIVVLGDHTSITFGKNLLERLRIPLIFYAPGLPHIENTDKIWASQVDVLPTVLSLMRGEHLYAGMGRNLLDTSKTFTGVASGTRDTGFFVTQDWVLQYHPFGGSSQLFAVSDGIASPDDSAMEKPDVLKALTQKCFARVELARRLSLDRRVFPLPPERQYISLAAQRDLSQLPR
jgi:hypothetical protein